MNHYEPGDIVLIEKHLLSYVVGRSAEIRNGPHSAERCAQLHPLLPAAAPGEPWYVLIDVTGQMRAAAHSWLRRAPPVWGLCARDHAEVEEERSDERR